MTSHTIQLGNISKSQTFFLYWIGKILFKFNTTREFKENSTLMKVHSSNFFYGPIISDGLIPSLQCRQSIPTTLNEINTFAPKRTEGKAHLRLISSTTFPKNIYIYTHRNLYSHKTPDNQTEKECSTRLSFNQEKCSHPYKKLPYSVQQQNLSPKLFEVNYESSTN